MGRSKLSVVVSISMLLALLGLSSAVADGPEGAAGVVGSFEIDGNSADDTGAGEPIDWNTPPPNVIKFTDLAKNKNDNSFGLGSKELEPGGWVCSAGGVPAKDDIVSGALAFRTFGGKQFVYANWVRLATNGDAHVDYEFNQSSEPNPACPETPLRTDGDILLTFDTELGGKIITVRAFQWQFTGPGIGVFNQLVIGAKHSTWDGSVNIPPERSDPGLKAGAFGELSLNLTDTIGDISCGRFAKAYMKTRASSEINAALKDRTTPVDLGVVEPNPEAAHASGSGAGAKVKDSALALDVSLPVDDENHLGTSAVDSSQSGLGSDSDSEAVLDVDVPPPSPGSLLQADAVHASSKSVVSTSPLAADQTSIGEAAAVNLLNGTVTANVVRAVAFTRATGSSASYSSAGSAIKDLMIDPDGPSGPLGPVPHNNVAPNTTIDLSAAFGPGSFAKLYEETVTTTSPTPGDFTGGTYAADLTVNMIRLHATDRDPTTPLTQETSDIIVAQAVAHSDMPATIVCPGAVSGHAFIASESTDPSVLPATVGFVSIPATGGSSHQHLDSLVVGSGGSLVSAEASDSDSTGTVGETGTSATSSAQAANVCVLKDPATGACTVSATVVKSQASSSASEAGASSTDDGTVLVDVNVLGSPVTPARNTRLEPLPGVVVILNEQFCDASGTPPACPGSSSTGLTVRAIHVIITRGGALGLPAGAEIIVAEAHSDATF